MHHRVDSDDSGDGKQLDPVTIAAKSVTTIFGIIMIACFVMPFYVMHAGRMSPSWQLLT